MINDLEKSKNDEEYGRVCCRCWHSVCDPCDEECDNHPIDKDKRRWVEAPSADECVELVKSGLHLCEWDDTYMSPEGVPILQTAWAYEYQLDVRYRGAYTEEPDFWHLTENVSY